MTNYYKITEGPYKNCVGTIDRSIPGYKEFGNVMFYSKEGRNPYRVCVHSSKVEEIG